MAVAFIAMSQGEESDDDGTDGRVIIKLPVLFSNRISNLPDVFLLIVDVISFCDSKFQHKRWLGNLIEPSRITSTCRAVSCSNFSTLLNVSVRGRCEKDSGKEVGRRGKRL